MRKSKKEVLRVAMRLAEKFAAVADGSFATKRGGERVSVTPYAHGAAAALGMLVVYAEGGPEPDMTDVIVTAMEWSEKHANRATRVEYDGCKVKHVDLTDDDGGEADDE